MLTLAVTSSTAVVGVALTRDLEVLSECHIVTDRRHAEELTPMIREVLGVAGIGLDEIDRFAVDIGPGRFTGLRVGLATVRTLAFAKHKPVVGVSSLETLAAAVLDPAAKSSSLSSAATKSEVCVVAVIDARRSEVFQQRFSPDGPVGDPHFGSPQDMARLVVPGDVVVGDGADRYVDVYAACDGATHRSGIEPLAVNVARLSVGREAQDGSLVAPVYLRDPDVNVNIKTRHNT